MDFSNDQIEKLIADIESGAVTGASLPVDYYTALTDYLAKAVQTGFGASVETVSAADEKLFKDLLVNTYHFGAAKTYQQTDAMVEILKTSESSADFNAKARALYTNWNDNYGRTDYNTAVAQADMALKWQDIQASKEAVPNLMYSAIGDACPICQPLDGLTAPVDDPIWDSVYPVNHPNCFCTVLQVNDPVSDNYKDIADNSASKMDDTYINNVGKTAEIWPASHPYFAEAPEALKEINFGLPIPEELSVIKQEMIPLDILKAWKVELNPALNDLLVEPIALNPSKRGSYMVHEKGPVAPGTPKTSVNIDRGARYKDSPYHQESIFYHEIGHAIHEQNKIITFGKSVSEGYATHFNELKGLVKDPFAINMNLDNLAQVLVKSPNLWAEYACKTKEDVLNMYSGTMDALMSLTNGKYGGGHTAAYMKQVGAKEAEMFAHSMENHFVGNPMFKKVMPEVYEKSSSYIKSLITK
jgi:SPP1 gp7 family putative phage head morphogenesis protein